MEPVTRITLVRHGQVNNPDNVFYGRRPRFRLSAEGRRQAELAAGVLKDEEPAAIYSSPLLRARQTANEILKYHPGMRLHISRLINEVHSPYEGLPVQVVEARNGDIYSHSPPPYEQPADVAARALKFLTRMRSRHGGRHIIAVTHGDVLVFTVLRLRGLPLTPESKIRWVTERIDGGYPAPASLTTLTYRSPDPDTLPAIAHLKPYRKTGAT
jgi:broad specificity phosphatase PhoE